MKLALSPIQYKDSKLLSISFDNSLQAETATSKPSSDTSTSNKRFFSLSIDRNLDYIDEGSGNLACKASLRFTWDIKTSDEEDASPIATVAGAMGALASCPIDLGDVETVKRTLAANTLSYIWSKLRTVVEQLSSQSPVGTLSLPAIDPLSLLEDQT